MSDDPLSGFETVEVIAGWRCGSQRPYSDTVVIACSCGHLSVRDRDEIDSHECPACGAYSAAVEVSSNPIALRALLAWCVGWLLACALVGGAVTALCRAIAGAVGL